MDDIATQSIDEYVDEVIDRMHELVSQGMVKDAISLYEEIRDWVRSKK